MEGILIADGPAFLPGTEPVGAALLDIAPTVLHLLGVPVPADMDGRVLHELLDPLNVPVCPTDRSPVSASRVPPTAVLAGCSGHSKVEAELRGASLAADLAAAQAYSDEEDAHIQQRLADLGYL
jgi:hypothetical protein